MDTKPKNSEKSDIKAEFKKLVITLALTVVVGTSCAAGLYFAAISAFESFIEIEKVQHRILQ